MLDKKSTPFLRRDCEVRRISDKRFLCVVNRKEEYIDVDKTTGDLLEYILLLIDGKNTLRTIVDKAINIPKKSFSENSVKEIIGSLNKWGLLILLNLAEKKDLNNGNISFNQLSYFASKTSYPFELQKKLGKARIALIGARYVAPVILQSLYKSGIRSLYLIENRIIDSEERLFFSNRRLGKRCGLHEALVIEADYLGYNIHIGLLPGLKDRRFVPSLKSIDLILMLDPSVSSGAILEINDACIESKTSLLFGRLDNYTATLGPYVLPNESACMLCKELRYRQNSEVIAKNIDLYQSEYRHERTIQPTLILSFISAFANIICGIGCSHFLEVANILVNAEIVMDFETLDVVKRFILKLPRCPACGNLRVRPEDKGIDLRKR